MVSSLKSKHADRMDIYIDSREFLRIFTDAANHIPRHRRTKLVFCTPGVLRDPHVNIRRFFSHLVDVLGPEDFLAPVSMLLIDKVVNRVIRQTVDEIQASLALPLSILQHYPHAMQISVKLLITPLAASLTRPHRYLRSC